MRGEKRGMRYVFSFLLWAAWVALFCAIILAFEIYTGYFSVTGLISNRPFVAFVVIMIAVASLVRPEIPLLIAVFFTPLVPMGYPGITFVRGHLANMEIIHPMIFCAILGWFFRALRRGEPLIEGNPLTVPFFLYLAWSALSLFWCFAPGMAKWELLDLSFGIMVYIAAVKVIRTRAMLDRVVKLWIISGVLLTRLGISFIMTGAAGRVEAMTGHPNVLSVEMNLIIMFVIAMLYMGKGKFMPPWILCPLLAFMLLVDLRTGSRAGFFSLLVALLYFFFSYYSLSKDKKRISLVLFFAVVLLACAVFFIAFNPLEGLKIGFRGYNPIEFPEETTFQFRLKIWGVAWDYIRSSGSYIQGIGAMSFMLLTESEYWPVNHPHSIYFYVGVHYGLVGLAIFFWFIFRLVRELRAGMREARSMYYQVLLRAMAAGLLAFAIHGIVDFDLAHRREVWLYIGVAMAAVKLARKERG